MSDGERPGRLDVLHKAFGASLLLKGLFAGAETLAGLVLFFFDNAVIRDAIQWLTAHEITEDPKDLLAGALLSASQSLSLDLQHFYAVYLLGHGALKLAVVLLLVRGYLWAYPLAVALLSGFIVYQMHRYLAEPAMVLILLSLLDAVVIALTLIEYRRVRRLP